MPTPALQPLDPDMRSAVQAELRPREQVVWASSAIPRYLSVATIVPALFAIPWTGFAIFWTCMAFNATRHSSANDHTPAAFRYAFPLFGVPFILVGLGMLSSPYWSARKLKRTIYLITDARAVVLSPGWFGARKVQTFMPERLASMERVERRDGSGDLVFEQFTHRSGKNTQTIRKGFISIPRVREVEDLLRKTLLTGRTRAA